MDEIMPVEEGPNVNEGESVATVMRIRELLIGGSSDEALSIITSSPENFVNNLIEVEKNDIYLVPHVLQLLKEKCCNEFITLLLQTLHSSAACARKFALEQLYKIIKDSANALSTPAHISSYATILELVGDKDPGVFNKAILIASELDVENCPQVLEGLRVPLKGSATSRCNAFEVIVNLSTKSEKNLNILSEAGFIDLMVDELIKSTDILYQLNLLELLTRLVVTPHGFSYFAERQIFEAIADMVPIVMEHPMKSLLLPGYLKFFGAVAHLHPSGALRYYTSVVDCLFDTLESGEPSLLRVALDTLGHIGSTLEGKRCLAEIGGKFQSVVSSVSAYIRNAPTDVKVRALSCMEGLIGVERDPKHKPDSPVDIRITLMTREWFRSMNPHGSAMELLYENCKNPFPDIRLTALVLLDAACQHNWGAEMVASTPGFIEYLLDRSVDHTKECREAKYSVLKRLATSPAFDPSVTLRIAKFVEQGPFYSEKTLDVAMEGDG